MPFQKYLYKKSTFENLEDVFPFFMIHWSRCIFKTINDYIRKLLFYLNAYYDQSAKKI